MTQIIQVQQGSTSTQQRFVDVETLSNFGSKFTHEEFLSELVNQNDNRKDFLFKPSEGQFTGTKFMINDQVFDLDSVSLVTLAERFKVSGTHTITRTGLMELSFNPSLFEQTANYFLHRMKKPLQFRTLFDVGMAFPSKNYTKVNHLDFISAMSSTLGEITNSPVVTEKHYLHKELMYCYIPINGLEIDFINSKGEKDFLQLGLECRNSEILKNGISVSFKVIRKSTNEGFLLSDQFNDVYHRHIGMTTEEAVDLIQKDVISLFKSNAIHQAVETLEFIKTLFETPAVNGVKIAENFAKSLKLPAKETQDFLMMAELHNDSSLYGWTFGPYNRLFRSRTNSRQRFEQEERLLGSLVSTVKSKEDLLSMNE